MNVLMISWEYPPYMLGGMGKHVAELLPALARLGLRRPDFRLDLITSGVQGGPAVEKLSDQITVHRLNVRPIDPKDLYNSVVDSNRIFERYARILAEEAPFDLIHAHDWLTASAGIALKHAWKAPLVATIHATERGRHHSHIPDETSYKIDRLEWQLCYEAWRIIVCSGFMAGELGAFFDVPLDKISVIPNGVDTAPLQSCPPEEV
ncbi:MAG: glycosyltransferase family 1 protein, partial [Caldilineae bacterium]